MQQQRPAAALLWSRSSCVQLCATPETAAHQAPPSLGLSRQEHWSGLPLPSPVYHARDLKSYEANLLVTELLVII